MRDSRPNSHAIAAIRDRLGRVSGELIAVEKQWRDLREQHHALSQTLRMFDPDADSSAVAPKRPYRRTWPSDKGKLSRLVLDAMRACERPMTSPELVASMADSVREIPSIERRVRMTLNRLTRAHGGVTKEGARQATKWSLSRRNNFALASEHTGPHLVEDLGAV
jgi:hypothetical protein